jgi:paraquat-inducible protein A
VLPGVYFFAASALLTMLAYGWANSIAPQGSHQTSSLQARLENLGDTDQTFAR